MGIDASLVGTRVRESRLAAGLSQNDLEQLSGIPKARISRYENGHVEPSIRTLKRLARALGLSYAFLLAEEIDAREVFMEVLSAQGVAFSSLEQAARISEAVADALTMPETR